MTDLMPLTQALGILARVHTRDDPELGCIVLMGATPPPLYDSHADYTEAWRSVRHAINLPSAPPEKL
jgi:hypothetical protein